MTNIKSQVPDPRNRVLSQTRKQTIDAIREDESGHNSVFCLLISPLQDWIHSTLKGIYSMPFPPNVPRTAAAAAAAAEPSSSSLLLSLTTNYMLGTAPEDMALRGGYHHNTDTTSPFHTERNWSSEKLSDFPRVTQPGGIRTKTYTCFWWKPLLSPGTTLSRLHIKYVSIVLWPQRLCVPRIFLSKVSVCR